MYKESLPRDFLKDSIHLDISYFHCVDWETNFGTSVVKPDTSKNLFPISVQMFNASIPGDDCLFNKT